jgi:co-chaperonin GroES (HSP10)
MSSKLSGYTSSGVSFEEMTLRGHWVVLAEVWDRPAPEGILLLQPKNTTIGKVLAVGERVDEEIYVGDKVLFEEWQGGRWTFVDSEGNAAPCLLIDETFIRARLED